MEKAGAQIGMSERKAIDWEGIELDYRAGIKTLRQIAEQNGVSHVAINKRAKRDGWDRDISAKVQAKADALVTKSLVTNIVTKEKAEAEKAVIDANAQAIADIRIGHHTMIQRGRRLTESLLSELEKETDPATLDLLRDLGDFLRDENDAGADKRNDLYRRMISLPERSKTMKTIAESMRMLIDMERQAFGMDKLDIQRLDITSGGKSISGDDLRKMSDDELARIVAKG